MLVMKKISLRGVNLSKVTTVRKGRPSVITNLCKSFLQYCLFCSNHPAYAMWTNNSDWIENRFLSMSSTPILGNILLCSHHAL